MGVGEACGDRPTKDTIQGRNFCPYNPVKPPDSVRASKDRPTKATLQEPRIL